MTRAVPVGLGERAYEVVVGDVLVGDDGGALGLQERSDVLARPVDQAGADHDVIGAGAEANGNRAGHAPTFDTCSRRAASTASTETWWGVSPVSTVMSACA